MECRPDLAEITETIHRDMQAHLGRGRVADYIPALARVDPRHFGIAVATCDGEVAAAGDADVSFSIQSITKVFTLTMALGKAGADLWRRVGREASGSAFNSIVQLEYEKGIPRNPLINAGALVVVDTLLDGGDPESLIGRITDQLRTLSGDPTVGVDPEVAASERATGFRNAAMANFLRASGNLKSDVADVLDVYFNRAR
jgi:glutaminase